MFNLIRTHTTKADLIT